MLCLWKNHPPRATKVRTDLALPPQPNSYEKQICLMKIRQLSQALKPGNRSDPMRAEKLFCISFQRTGTTSVGQFLKGLGYPTADWSVSQRNNWGRKWVNGQFDDIVQSDDFQRHQAFEDGPWFAPEFYRFLYHRFPRSKFILFERDAEAWFASMLSHSGGRSLGVTAVHAKVYRREKEYLELCARAASPEAVDMNGLELAGHKDHYVDLYRVRNRETRIFFGNAIATGSITASWKTPRNGKAWPHFWAMTRTAPRRCI